MVSVTSARTLRKVRVAPIWLDYSLEREMHRLFAVDLLVLDESGLDTLDPTESR